MKANNKSLRFQPSVCPKCGQLGFKVIESRTTDGLTRRRKACAKCGHRTTTYEVTQAFYRTATQNAQIVDKLRSALGGHTPAQGRHNSATCESCQYMTKGECSFGFPEAGGTFASECSTYILTR